MGNSDIRPVPFPLPFRPPARWTRRTHRTLAVVGLLLSALFALPLSSSASAESTASDAGDAHSCTIRADGAIACWGDDSSRQLDGIPGGEFVAVSAGGAHSCAIRTDATLACWGDDSSGQLDGIPGGKFIAVSAGGAHSCAVRVGGELDCWGDDSLGQLDAIPSAEFLSVSAGGAHSCGVRADGEVACWGSDSEGQVSGAETAFHLHMHNNDRHHPHPKDNPPQFIAVSAGAAHSCAVAADGDLVCWGSDSAGQRDGSPEGRFDSVSAGGAHSCAVSVGGELDCWGDDSLGQLDAIPGGEFVDVSAGGGHSCATRAGGGPACWGDNAEGQVQPVLRGAEPPRAVIGNPYGHQFETTPQAPPAEFDLIAGSLPSGLGLDSDGGLSGSATDAGDYAFTVAAANGITPAAEREVTLAVVGTPLLSLDGASGITTTSASLSGSLDPRNLAAEAWFEYWPSDSSPAGAARTPPQSIPKGLAPVGVFAQITGLSPGSDYLFRLAAVNELGAAPLHSQAQSLTTVALPAPVDLGLPPPVLGATINVEPANGVIRTKCPSDKKFSKLLSAEQIPISCLIDARRGTIDLTAATTGPQTQSGFFWGAVFGVSQKAARNWATNLKLTGPRRCERRKKKGASSSRRRKRGGRGLWGRGRGRFRTSGNYGSASVRGTTWLVRDRCDNSTLFAVREGIVRVRDFVKGRSLVLRAGQRYVAKAAIARLR